MSKIKISAKPKVSDQSKAKEKLNDKRNDKGKWKLKHTAKTNAVRWTEEETHLSMSETFPTLGQQILTCPKQHVKNGKSEEWLRLRPSWPTRFAMAGMAFAQGMLFAIMALVVLYLPDYVFDYGHREESFLVFFAKFLGVAVLCIALAAGFSTFIRETVVYIELQRGRVLVSRRLNAKTIQELAIAFRDVSCVKLRASEGMFRRSRLYLEFNTREPLLIAESRGRDEDLVALRDWLSRYAIRS